LALFLNNGFSGIFIGSHNFQLAEMRVTITIARGFSVCLHDSLSQNRHENQERLHISKDFERF